MRRHLISECNNFLRYHPSAFFPQEALLLFMEEDDADQNERRMASRIQNTVIKSHPFEGIALVQLGSLFLDLEKNSHSNPSNTDK